MSRNIRVDKIIPIRQNCYAIYTFPNLLCSHVAQATVHCSNCQQLLPLRTAVTVLSVHNAQGYGTCSSAAADGGHLTHQMTSKVDYPSEPIVYVLVQYR
jgi:hypothetical protein